MGREQEEANRANLEGVQRLDAASCRALALHKAQLAAGDWPALHVRHDAVEGFVVEAYAPIQAMTLICEYTGEVDWARRYEKDHADCLMDLLVLPRSEGRSLTISAQHTCNIARFINHSCAPNLVVQKWFINRLPRLGLFATQDIPAGAEVVGLGFGLRGRGRVRVRVRT